MCKFWLAKYKRVLNDRQMHNGDATSVDWVF